MATVLLSGGDMKPVFESTVHDILNEKLLALEEHFEADVIFYYGAIFAGLENNFKELVEELKEDKVKRDRLCIVLNTSGGSVETVELLVRVIRFHYEEVYFIIPSAAYSAGTIFCMSGDKIFMDYSSSLGPIDPQVINDKGIWVPALGYLDKVDELIEKSNKGELSPAEMILLRDQDLAMLRRYEQARDLSVDLLKTFLINYKFKDWRVHSSSGAAVSEAEKKKRANEIAKQLGNNKIWHAHSRPIGIGCLADVLKLKIDDYSNNEVRRLLIRSYHDLLCQYIVSTKNGLNFVHTRKYI